MGDGALAVLGIHANCCVAAPRLTDAGLAGDTSVVRSAGARFGLYGAPGVGKSTVVEQLVARLRACGAPVGGFVTREVRQAQRVGFTCHDLAGSQVLIAHVDWRRGPRVGRYGVDVAAFESVALPTMERTGPGQVLIVDEVGPMELLSTAFVQHLQEVLDQPGPVVLTMHSRTHPVTDALRARSDLQLMEVTPGNRQHLAAQLHERLNRAA